MEQFKTPRNMIYVFNIHIFICNRFPVLSFLCTRDGLSFCVHCALYIFLDILSKVKVIAHIYDDEFFMAIFERWK